VPAWKACRADVVHDLKEQTGEDRRGRRGLSLLAPRNLLVVGQLALSFVLLVSAELIVAQSGFGYLIGFLGEGGTYDAMFAVVLTVAFLGFVADRLYQWLMHRVLQWQE
jgi:hypothetical protein